MTKEQITTLIKSIDYIYGLESILKSYEIDREIENLVFQLNGKEHEY